jgi:hypothetical protein
METKGISTGPFQTGIIFLTLVTALVHLIFLNISMGKLDTLFTLNGLAYLALLAAFVLPQFQGMHALVRWALAGFAVVTIIAWLFMGDKSWWLGWVTKLDELALIGLLVLEGRQTQ